MHKIVVLLIISLISVFGSVWHNFQIVKTGKLISQKERMLEDLKLQQRILDVKISKLKSLDRIEKISKEELGLVKSSDNRVIYNENIVREPKIVEIKFPEKQNIVMRFMGSLIPMAQAETLKKS